MNAREKTDEERLEEECKRWSPEQWEFYLTTLEVPMREQELEEAHQAELLTNEMHGELWGNGEGELSERTIELKERLRENMSVLPAQERECLRLIFWEGRTIVKAAIEMGVSTRTIDRWKKSALEKLKLLLEEEV